MEMPSGTARCLQPRSNVDTVAVNVAPIRDHIAQIDPDAEPDPAFFGHPRLTVDHSALDLDRAPDRVDHAWKFGEQTVTGILYGPAPVLSDLRIDYFAEMRFEAFVRTLFVRTHETRVTGHISGKDGGKAARRGHSSGRPPGRTFDLFNYSTSSRVTTCAPARCRNTVGTPF
jgi:hypothetical protein